MEKIIEFNDGKDTYEVPESEAEAFASAVPNARRMTDFVGKDGSRYAVPDDEVEAFRAAVTDVEPVSHYQLSGGQKYNVAQSRMSKFLRSREFREGDAAAREAMLSRIDAETPMPDAQGVVSAAAEAALKGGTRAAGKIAGAFVGIGTGPMWAVGSLFGRDNALVKGADWVDDKLDWFAEDLGVGGTSGNKAQDVLSAAGEIGSSVAANLMPWMVGGGVASKIAGRALFAANVAGAGGRSATETYDKVKEMGGDDAEAYTASLQAQAVSTAAAFVFGKLSVENYLKGFGAKGVAKLIEGEVKTAGKGFNGIVKAVANGHMRRDIAKMLIGSAEEGVTEGAESFLLSVIQQHAGKDNVDFEEAALTALKDAAIGAGTGLVLGGLRVAEGSKGFRGVYEKQARAEVSQLMADMAPGDIREMNPKKFDEIAKKFARGEGVSRKDADELGLPPNWSKEQRNEVFSEWQAEKAELRRRRAKMDGVQEQALRDDIAGFVGDGPEAQRVYDRVVQNLKDAIVLDDPTAREKLIGEAAEAEEAAIRAENDAQERANAEAWASEGNRDNEFMLAREESRAKGGLNETRTDEAQPQPDEVPRVTPPAGEAARPLEAGEAQTEVGGAVEAPILSGDEVRKTMPGYDPKNWRTHVDRKGDFVAPRMEARFQELLKTRKGKGNGEVVFLAGGNGSGKSTVANALGGTPDFIIDSTLGNLAVAKKQIETVIANGQKPVIDFVYRSSGQALEGVVGRVKKGGHAVSPVSFADSHTKGIKNLRLLADEYGDKISIRIFDNSVEGQPEISLKQLEEKGIPDYEELRKRANEVLGQYDGRGLAVESNKSSTSESGGGSENTQSDSKARVEVPTSAPTEAQANTPPTTAESAEGGYQASNAAAKKPFEERYREWAEEDVPAWAKDLSPEDKAEYERLLDDVTTDKGETDAERAEHVAQALAAIEAFEKAHTPKRGRGRPKKVAAETKAPEAKVEMPKAETAAEPEAPKSAKPDMKPVIAAMHKLGDLAMSDVATLEKALREAEAREQADRADNIRTFLDYKKSVGVNPDPKSDKTQGGRYRASIESEKSLDDPKFRAWAKRRGAAPTQQKREEYDAAMVKQATKRLSRWIKGVKVRMVNAIGEGDFGEDARPAIKQAEYDAWNKILDDYENKNFDSTKDYPVLSRMPAVLRKIGVNDLPITMRGGILQKITGEIKTSTGEHHGIPVSELRNLQIELDNPIAVFDSASRDDSIVVLTRLVDNQNNERAVVALRLDQAGSGSARINAITSAYGKNKDSFEIWIKDKKLLRYVNKEARNESARWLQLPGDSKFRALNILTEKDFSNEDLGRIVSQQPSVGNPHLRPLRDGKRIVGSYNLKTGEVTLAKGASVETVAHELGWHAAFDWAKRNAATNERAGVLYERMRSFADEAPDAVKAEIAALYGKLDADAFADEVGAALFVRGQAEQFAGAIDPMVDAPWYKKAWRTVVDIVKDWLSSLGMNRVDLDGVEEMSERRFSEFLATAMLSGKTLGERKGFSMDLDMSKRAKWERKLSDRFAPIKELMERVEGNNGEAYRMARTLEGMAQMGKNRAERAMKRVDKILVANDISPELLAQYMQAMAYEERNAKIEKRNRKKDGSGMTQKGAEDIFAEIDERGVREKCQEAADILWKLQTEGLQARVDAGLIDHKTAVMWMLDEPHHVPWRDAIDPDTGEWMGRNFAGKEFEIAEGRSTFASGDPITLMLQEYENAYTRAAENALRQNLADIARLNTDVGTIYDSIQVDAKGHRSFIKFPAKGEKAKMLAIPDGSKIESTKAGDGGMANILTYRENGETKYLALNGSLGEAIAAAVTGRSLLRPPALLSKFMRGYAATATALSPTFAIRNTMADHFDIHGNMVKDFGLLKGEKMYAKMVAEEVKMSKELLKYVHTGDFAHDANGKATTAFGKLIEEYEAAGGLIGGLRTEGYDVIQKRIRADFRAGRNKLRSVGRELAAGWTDLQKMSELSTRLAAFKVMKESGMSAKEAVMWSRESTVDFNKKGNWTPISNILWMFSNSALGSGVRQAKGLLTTKNGLQLATGLAAWGFIEGMLECAMNEGYDDEEEKRGSGTGADLNEYTRQNSAYLRFGDTVYRTNLHMGPYGIIKYAGNVAARVMSGRLTAEKAAKELGLTAAEVAAAFTGIGNVSADAILETGVPTALQPFVQGITGKDYAGRPLYRKKYDEAKPDSSHGRKSTAAGYQWLAKKVNEITGGDEYSKGGIDIAPETVKLITETAGKNFVRDIVNIVQTSVRTLSGENEPQNIPFVRDVKRKVDGNENRYYEAMRRYDADKLKLKDPNLKGEERRAFLNAHPWLKSNGKKGSTVVSTLETRIKDLMKKEENPNLSDERKEELKTLRRRLQARVIEKMSQ